MRGVLRWLDFDDKHLELGRLLEQARTEEGYRLMLIAGIILVVFVGMYLGGGCEIMGHDDSGKDMR